MSEKKKRRGRGKDFIHRFAGSRWAEDLLLATLNQDGTGLRCVRLGLSRTSKDGNPHKDDVDVKEPDLLIFDLKKLTKEDHDLLNLTDLTKRRASQISSEETLKRVVGSACAAIEVEFSPYKALEMKGREWKLKSAEELAKKPRKHATRPTAPTIIVKLEDMPRLVCWRDRFRVPIVVVHVFDQAAFAVDLSKVLAFQNLLLAAQDTQAIINLQLQNGIFYEMESFNRSDAQAASEKKMVFKVVPAAAAKIGDVDGLKVRSRVDVSPSKKYLPRLLFKGGSLALDPTFLAHLRSFKD